MTYDAEHHHRRSIRLRGYDYTQAGAYFITICTQNRRSLFGRIVNGTMQLNDAGRMVESIWNTLPLLHPGLETDAFIVMPNHIHGIIFIVGAGLPAPIQDERDDDREMADQAENERSSTRVAPTEIQKIGDIIGEFKSRVTVEYIRGVKTRGWKGFDQRLLQRNYFEHIIRNERALNLIRQYIAENPQKWEESLENPENSPFDDLSFVIDPFLIEEEGES
jgi:REP element-mobilizing transposase RayT